MQNNSADKGGQNVFSRLKNFFKSLYKSEEQRPSTAQPSLEEPYLNNNDKSTSHTNEQIHSTCSESSNFKNELAAKLNAGPLPGGFRGLRKPVPHFSLPEKEDSTYVTGPQPPSESSAPEKPKADAYMEHALLRINLNKQRKHRPARNIQQHQAVPAPVTNSDLFASPLDNITEEGDLKEVVSDSQPISPSKPRESVIILRPRNSNGERNDSKRATSEIVQGSPASSADQRADSSRFSCSTEKIASLRLSERVPSIVDENEGSDCDERISECESINVDEGGRSNSYGILYKTSF